MHSTPCKEKYKLLTSARRIANVMGFNVTNVRRTYVNNWCKRKNVTRALDFMTLVVENGFTDEEILLALRTIRATKDEIIKNIGDK